ncbi:MAG TPA: hypothetical protein VFS31_15940, partial [Chitinophagaceae bacterium]|nr:hypothetical protein [Chitinophagaceae bacterium]
MKLFLRICTLSLFFFACSFNGKTQTFQYDWANVYGSSASYYYTYSYNCGSWSYPSYCTGYSYRYAQNEVKSSFYNTSGNIVLAGNYVGEFDADPGSGSVLIPGDYSLVSRNAYFGNYDAAGNLLWAKNITGTYMDLIKIGRDATGNIYLVLNYYGTIDADPSASVASFSSSGGSNDLFIGKYSASGNFLWGRSIGGTNTEQTQSAAIDANGNIYLQGYYYAAFDADAGAGTTTLPAPGGGRDIFALKYSSDGNFSWGKAITGTNYEDPAAIALNAGGEVYLGGYFYGTMDANPGAAAVSYTSSGNNGFIIKLDASGNYIWSKQLVSSNSFVQRLNVDGAGNLVTTGTFNTSVDLDPLTSAGVISTNGSWICKYDGSGNYLWGYRLDQVDGLGDIQFDSQNKIFITWRVSTSTFDADPGAGSVPLAAYGAGDIVFAVYNSNGSYQTAFRIGSSDYDTP